MQHWQDSCSSFGNYKETQRVLVYLPLIFMSYVAAAFLARPNWSDVLRSSLIPHLSFIGPMISGAIALLGTTLTAYAYVWQTIEMSEETTPVSRLGLVQVDATLGTVIAGTTFWFVVIATGATLGVHHKVVQTAQDAANALTPFAGHWAKLLFGMGLLASALIAIPVVSATSAYVASEMFGWTRGIDKKFWRRQEILHDLSCSPCRRRRASPLRASRQSSCCSSVRSQEVLQRPSR